MQLSAIDLNLLVILDALLSTRSVKEAAERVARSPSATSHALARLRQMLGDELLVRAGKQLVLTPRAQRLTPRVREAIEAVQGVLSPEPEFVPANLERNFSVMTTDMVELILGELLSSHMVEVAPKVNLYFHSLGRDMQNALRNEELDVALGVFRDVSDDILSEPVFSDRYVCLLRSGHPVLDEDLGIEQYAALEHVLIAPRGTPIGVVDEVLVGHGLTRRIARTVANFFAAPYMVRNSDYIVTMSERIAAPMAKSLGLVIRDLPFEMPGFVVKQLWHRRLDDDFAQQWFRGQIQAIGKQLEEQSQGAQ